MISVLNIERDIHHLEAFADSCEIPQLKECFVEIKEIISALLNPDLPHMVIDSPSSVGALKREYPKLDFAKLAIIYDKVNICNSHNTIY